MPEAPVDDWLIVLRPDGTVESVQGGAPVTWLGRAFVDIPGAPDALRNLAAELLRAPAQAFVRRQKARCTVATKSVDIELLVVEALPLRRAHTRVDALVARTLDAFVSQARSSRVDLHIEQAADVPPVIVADGEKIAWALATLVGNALRFAQQREEGEGAPHVDVRIRWDGATNEVAFVVTDNGPGMAEKHARWLFERNPADGRSAGLALLMVRDVVAAHRGTVSVESAPGRGTSFTMRIPR